MKLYFASSNLHKKAEMERLLFPNKLVLPSEIGLTFDVDETGSTYIQNALLKAEALYKIVKAPVLSDDSGLEVEALNLAPGVHSARYGEKYGKLLSSKEKNALLLKNLEPYTNRKAHFVTCLCLYLSPSRIYIIQESVEGEIIKEEKGINGFGYDPIFYNNEAKSVVALLNEEEKDIYSHRGKAARKLIKLLEE